MANFTKFLGASIGWSFAGPIGAVVGFVLGSFIDGFSQTDINYQGQRTNNTKYRTTTSGDFEISLLILSAIVIKADGKVDKKELEYVRKHFVKMYGVARANNAFKLFKGVIKANNISTRQVCFQISQQMAHASRLQLIHFLFGIANADGTVVKKEIDSIRTISRYLNISTVDFESIKSMFYKPFNNDPYKILQVSRTATLAEVKKAYRKLAKKYHPDKLQHLGKEHVKEVENKFRAIQNAYECIKKEIG